MFFAEAARIIYEICLALEFLHTNDIAHRDLKVSENDLKLIMIIVS